jgi:hypothetical protein
LEQQRDNTMHEAQSTKNKAQKSAFVGWWSKISLLDFEICRLL